MNKELSLFFKMFFNIDSKEDDLQNALFPTFEEALGILDLAERRRESLKNFELESLAHKNNRIRHIKQYLILLMAKIIHDKLMTSKKIHEGLVNRLNSAKQLKNTVFISTNYDILIDNAVASLYPNNLLDYGIDFTNFYNPNDWIRPDESAIKLYKIHGSLNWIFCPTCNNITLTPREKGVYTRLVLKTKASKCSSCKSTIVPIIVPPTYFKDMSNVFLSLVWNKAEQALRNVDHIVFCGYSFPDADIHIKYLLKRIQSNRNTNLKISVFNNHVDKCLLRSIRSSSVMF
jgi:NAD-dependent SIR2 family protein deacetylase